METNIKINIKEDYIIIHNGLPNDVSIFTINEWNELLKMSKVITRHAFYYYDKQINNTNEEYKKHASVLYDNYKAGFSVLYDYKMKGNKVLGMNIKNVVRSWIIENYSKINESYNYLCNITPFSFNNTMVKSL